MRRFSSRLRRSTNKLSFIGFIIFRLQGGLVWEFNNYIYPSSTTNINIESFKKKNGKIQVQPRISFAQIIFFGFFFTTETITRLVSWVFNLSSLERKKL